MGKNKVEQNVNEYIEKIKIPWWVYGAVAFLLRRDIFSILRFFIPGIRRVKTFKDLFKNKRND